MLGSAVRVCPGLQGIEKCKNSYGGLAQLARAPALHAGGQRFESVILHFLKLLSNKLSEVGSLFNSKELNNWFDSNIIHRIRKD